MVLVKLNASRYMTYKLLPRIAAMARKRSCSRSDAIRDILYLNFHYKPAPIDHENIYTLEVNAERLGRGTFVYVEPKFYDLLLAHSQKRRWRLDTIVEYILDCFLPLRKNPYHNGISLGPGKGIVKAVRTAEGYAQYANRKKANT